MGRIYYYKETNISIFLLETLVTSIILSMVLWKSFDYHWAINFVTVFAIFLLFFTLFLKWAITRYLITLFYSMIYGFLFYRIGRSLQSDSIIVGIMFAYIAYFVSISFHVAEYRALKN